MLFLKSYTKLDRRGHYWAQKACSKRCTLRQNELDEVDARLEHSPTKSLTDCTGFVRLKFQASIYYLYIHSYMFRSYDHHQVEKYITTLGLLN
jgi:hypothetical protein